MTFDDFYLKCSMIVCRRMLKKGRLSPKNIQTSTIFKVDVLGKVSITESIMVDRTSMMTKLTPIEHSKKFSFR